MTVGSALSGIESEWLHEREKVRVRIRVRIRVRVRVRVRHGV